LFIEKKALFHAPVKQRLTDARVRAWNQGRAAVIFIREYAESV
jgi:hypothetical protein